MSSLRVLYLGLLLWSVASPRALAEPPPGWAAQADTVFHHFPVTATEMRYAAAIEQDGQGFIWIGTEGGLARWDGYHTRLYQADPEDPGALPSNPVLALHADSLGRLWVGTDAGLARYDAQLDRFVPCSAGPGGLGDPNVSAIAADGERGLWIGTGTGLERFDIASDTVRKVALPNGDHTAVKAVMQARDGGLWVGTQQGVYLRTTASGPFRAVPLPGSGSAPVAVSRLLQDSAGRVWIGTRSHGAFVVEPGQPLPRTVGGGGDGSRLKGTIVRSMIEATPGQIWLGTAGGGIVVVEPAAGWHTLRIRHHVAIDTSLKDDNVSAMLRDRSGLIWVSTTMAMDLHDPRQGSVWTLFGATTRDRPITSVQVSAVLATPEGRVWVGNGDGGGIELLDPVQGRIGEVRPDPSRPARALPQGRVLAMAWGGDGQLYLGTLKGLYRADAQGRQVVRVQVPSRPVDAPVYSLCTDEGTLWMGGDDGLWRLAIPRGKAPTLARHDSTGVVGSEHVSAILRGAGSVLWVGTASGLSQLDLASGALRRMAGDGKDPTQWPTGYVSSLLIDRQGRLWVSLIGGGIHVIGPSDAGGQVKARRLGIREGLPHASVNKLLLDAAGTVWASTDRGLAEIDPSTFAVRALGEPQGVAISEYWADAGGATTAGDLVFGGMGGATVVRPTPTRPEAAAPPVVVTLAHAGARPLPAGTFNRTSADAPVRLDLQPEDGSLRVEFAALDFTAPELNRYSYRLRGFDRDWTATDSARRLASYTNLPPGDYTLELRGSGHEAPWTASTLELPVRVLPAWYQTALFRWAVVLAALVGVAATVQLRTAFLRRRQRELQALVALRTTELVQRGEELRASQQELQKIAYCDPLTGLANRRLLNEELRHLVAQAMRGIGEVTLLLIDLDGFKQINDTAGHDAGDALLVEVARRLLATVRAADRVARLGGDEFTVLLAESVGSDDAEAACRRIVQALALPFEHAGRTLKVSASIGGARCPADADDSQALYKYADLALYEVKKAGRNDWRWFRSLATSP